MTERKKRIVMSLVSYNIQISGLGLYGYRDNGKERIERDAKKEVLVISLVTSTTCKPQARMKDMCLLDSSFAIMRI